MVTVHYTGWTTDGKMFDSSYARGKPSTFGVGQRHQGLGRGRAADGRRREAAALDSAGARLRGQPGRARRACSSSTSSCSRSAASPTVAPPDVAAPPADAKKTPSGLAYKVLRAGTGNDAPERRSRVTVHYTGWTTDGKMFDSSVERGTPATFGLDEVIPAGPKACS